MKKHILNLGLAFLLPFAVMAQAGWQLPGYQKFSLKNGLVVYLMEQHEVPLISFGFAAPAGAIHDGPKQGLASLTGNALSFGTKSFTKDEIDAKVDYVGATLESAVGAERATLFGQFAVKDQDLIWKIASEMLLLPNFDAKEFEKAKTRQLQELEIAKESPRQVIGSYWNSFVYDGHPYANPTGGTIPGVEAITLEDVKQFYKTRYTAAGSAIAVVGDFKTADMKARITQLFGPMQGTKAANQPLATPNLNFKESRVLLVNKDDSHETRFFIGGQGVPRNHPDYVGIQVINTILGGRFTSWLNTELRINSGLSYGARSTFECSKLSGTFYMSSFTATPTSIKAIDLALTVLDSLHKYGPDAKTLASARNYILGGFAPEYETTLQLADLLLDFHTYGIDERFINTFNAQVMAVDAERAKALITKYFPREKLQMMVIGKGAEIREGLAKYGKLSEKQITAAGY